MTLNTLGCSGYLSYWIVSCGKQSRRLYRTRFSVWIRKYHLDSFWCQVHITTLSNMIILSFFSCINWYFLYHSKKKKKKKNCWRLKSGRCRVSLPLDVRICENGWASNSSRFARTGASRELDVNDTSDGPLTALVSQTQTPVVCSKDPLIWRSTSTNDPVERHKVYITLASEMPVFVL